LHQARNLPGPLIDHILLKDIQLGHAVILILRGEFMKSWTHPGGKLRELGAESLTDAELLSILISTGTKGKPAEKVVQEILDKFGSFKGMANQPLEKFLEIKGLGDVKIIRIAAAFEIARRIVNQVLKEYNKD
jgi:DNA repair protein RadC